MSSLEELIASINDAGFSIHGLFQLTGPAKHKWRACINDGKDCWEFGEADSPFQALYNAVEKATITPGIPLPKIIPYGPDNSSPQKKELMLKEANKKIKLITLDDL